MIKEKLPYSQSALILGILSIAIACCCGGFIGLIFGLIGLNNSKKAIAIHYENSELYDGINNANTGRITSIIGIVIGLIYTAWLIFQISSGEYLLMIEEYQELLNE